MPADLFGEVLLWHTLRNALSRRRTGAAIDVIVAHRSVIVHDGRTYAEGEMVRLPADDVTTYEELGVVSRPAGLPLADCEPHSQS